MCLLFAVCHVCVCLFQLWFVYLACELRPGRLANIGATQRDPTPGNHI